MLDNMTCVRYNKFCTVSAVNFENRIAFEKTQPIVNS